MSKDYNEQLNGIAKSCLGCKSAPCKKACPISTDIPNIIKMFQEGECLEAGEKLFENNPLSLICSLVCPFENQCMGSCVRGIRGTSVDFPKIENYIMKKYLEEKNFKISGKNGKNITIIGAGPAGISASFYLIEKGYDVILYDNHDKIGGMLRYGIPDFRLSKDNLDLIEEKLLETGINFIGNKYFTKEDIEFLEQNKEIDAVLMCTGAWLPKKIELNGSDRQNVVYGIDFLKENINLGRGKKVVVIGAGNVAMDVARTAKRQGNNVLVAYRRTLEEAPATKAEINDAKEDGVEFLTQVTPLEITGDGIILKCNLDEKKIYKKCDYILLAVSQQPEFTPIDKEKFFYAGDLLTGPETIVKASFTGKEAAQQIEQYLTR